MNANFFTIVNEGIGLVPMAWLMVGAYWALVLIVIVLSPKLISTHAPG